MSLFKQAAFWLNCDSWITVVYYLFVIFFFVGKPDSKNFYRFFWWMCSRWLGLSTHLALLFSMPSTWARRWTAFPQFSLLMVVEPNHLYGGLRNLPICGHTRNFQVMQYYPCRHFVHQCALNSPCNTFTHPETVFEDANGIQLPIFSSQTSFSLTVCVVFTTTEAVELWYPFPWVYYFSIFWYIK